MYHFSRFYIFLSFRTCEELLMGETCWSARLLKLSLLGENQPMNRDYMPFVMFPWHFKILYKYKRMLFCLFMLILCPKFNVTGEDRLFL